MLKIVLSVAKLNTSTQLSKINTLIECLDNGKSSLLAEDENEDENGAEEAGEWVFRR